MTGSAFAEMGRVRASRGVTNNTGGTLVFTVPNGSVVNLWGSLTIFANCSISGLSTDQVDAGASSDAGHTMNFYLDSDTPGFTSLGDSGHNSTIPAPASAGLLALSGLALARRRR